MHPNDHVNMGQSSNDVIPTAIHVSAALGSRTSSLPALEHLHKTIEQKAKSVAGIVKTGRTHLMDAMPVTLGQELGGWAAQILSNIFRLKGALPRLTGLAQGGTAVGTGINAHPSSPRSSRPRSRSARGVGFHSRDNFFEAMSSQDAAVELSGQLEDDGREPDEDRERPALDEQRAARRPGEIALPALQPGSSIMPGKVNPVIPEAVAMVAAQSSATTRRSRSQASPAISS